MVNGMRDIAVFLVVLMLAAVPAMADQPVPPLRSPVTDLTHTLSGGEILQLESLLTGLQSKKGSQIAVLIVPTTAPETVEQYSLRVAEQWKIGRKGVDDGLLLVIAKNDRRMRFEVGYGLEGAIPDAVAKRIIAEVITPEFKNGKFYEGVRSGIEAAIKIISGEPLPPPSSGGNSGGDSPLVPLAIGGFVVSGMLRSIFGRLIAAVLGSGLAFAISAFFISLPAALLIAALAFVLLFFIDIGAQTGYSGRRSYSGSSSGGWSSGGSSFSGGGGSFGGGGASGSW